MRSEEQPAILNQDPYRGFTDGENTHGRDFLKYMGNSGWTSESRPRVFDGFAGNGGITSILISLGWLPQNITCADLYVPNPPTERARNADWKVMDLEKFAEKIGKHEKLDPDLEKLKGAYDLVFFAYPEYHEPYDDFHYKIQSEKLAILAGFLLREGGAVSCFGNHLDRRSDLFDQSDWTKDTNGSWRKTNNSASS